MFCTISRVAGSIEIGPRGLLGSTQCDKTAIAWSGSSEARLARDRRLAKARRVGGKTLVGGSPQSVELGLHSSEAAFGGAQLR